jgi:hypothetical protein
VTLYYYFDNHIFHVFLSIVLAFQIFNEAAPEPSSVTQNWQESGNTVTRTITFTKAFVFTMNVRQVVTIVDGKIARVENSQL